MKAFGLAVAIGILVTVGPGAAAHVERISTPAQPAMDLRLDGERFAWELAPIGAVKPSSRIVDLDCPAGAKAVEAEWRAADGRLIRCERYRLPDLAAFKDKVEAERLKIRIPFEMREDGKATVVIDGRDGVRVRNLVSGLPFKKGTHEVVWDGYAEDGTLVTPGDYSVRLATHPGLSYDYLGYFASGDEQDQWSPWGPNHVALRQGLAGRGRNAFASIFTEGGHSVPILDADGKFLFGYSDNWQNGNDALFLVNGPADRFYAVREKAGELQVFGYTWSHKELVKVRLEGAPKTRVVGAVAIGRTLHVANQLSGAVEAYDLIEDARETVVRRTAAAMPLSVPGAVTSHDGRLVLPVATNTLSLATDGKCLYAVEEGDHQISVYDFATRRLVRKIGRPGGLKIGPWEKDRLVNPTSVMVSEDGFLWVTENRFAPKRLSKWDVASGTCVFEKFGPSAYGYPGCGLDGEDPTRWMANDTLWRLDPAKGLDAPVAQSQASDLRYSRFGVGAGCSTAAGATADTPVPGQFMHYTFCRRDGKTYVWGQGMAPTLFELGADGVLRARALLANCHSYCRAAGVQKEESAEPKTLMAAYAAFFPEVKPDRLAKTVRNDRETLVVWTDRDGDAQIDAEELAFARLRPSAGYWGFWPEALDFTLPVTDTKDGCNYVLGFVGPNYSLPAALAAKKPLVGRLPAGTVRFGGETTSDTHGRALMLGQTPYMLGVSASGRIDWTMYNPFAGVHGAQKADLPVPGELQGLLFCLGVVPYSTEADVAALMNDHGRMFFLTTDGLYLDELFNDCRVSAKMGPELVGGEAFGGVFAYDRVNRRTILQAGGYRRYVIKGLDRVRETRRPLQVSREQILYAEAHPPRPRGTAARGPQSADVPATLSWQSGVSRIEARVSVAGEALKVAWNVPDVSPWVNNGIDPYLMFKTGDCVDFQFLNADGQPERLLISPKAGRPTENQVVWYRHRAGKGTPHDFSSPWRTHRVDDVRFPSDVKVSVRTAIGRTQVEALIPLAYFTRTAAADSRTLTSLVCDLGVIFGDDRGEINLSRSYWSNRETGLVNDVPGEIIPEPKKWGRLRFDVDAARSCAREVSLRSRGCLMNPGGILVNEAGFDGWDRTYAQNLESCGAGPVWDVSRQLLFVTAGRGRVNALRLDGTRVASYRLPEASKFGPTDTMVLTRTGDILVLAGGRDVGNGRYRQAGKVFRVAHDAADGASADVVARDVRAMSAREHDGRVALVRKGGEISMLDTATWTEATYGRITVEGADFYANMYDWLPDGTFAAVVRGDGLRRFADGREIGQPELIFPGRENKMERGRVIGEHIWSLQGETIKRVNARTLQHEPGVVFGGASGYFLGRVIHHYEVDAQGICEVGPGLYAVLTRANGAVWILKYDEATRLMLPVRRLGGLLEPRNLAIDAHGGVMADGLSLAFEQDPLAPPCEATPRMPERAMALLPNGLAVVVQDQHGDKVSFRHGLIGGEFSWGHHAEGVRSLDGPPSRPGMRKWAKLPRRTDVKRIVRPGGKVGYELWAQGMDGTNRIYTVDERGFPPTKAWYREEAGPLPDLTRFVATDGVFLAETDAAAGTLSLFALEADGSRRLLDRVTGLAEPSRVAINNGRLVVWERATQRLLRYVME